jgi:hypothetical protein
MSSRSLLLLVLLAPLLAGCERPAGAVASQDQQATSAIASATSEQQVGTTAAQVLDEMVAAYQGAESYFDNAEYCERHVYQADGVEVLPPPHVMSVAFRRPNCVRIQRNVPAGDGPGLEVTVACDGERYRAFISDLADQSLDRPADSMLVYNNISPDELLSRVLTPVPLENLYPQLDLLVSSKSAPPKLLAGAKSKLLASAEHGGVKCQRVELSRGDQAWVLWIDEAEHVLRRLDMPTEDVRLALDPSGNLKELELWIDFRDATIGTPLADSAFAVDFPVAAKPTEQLVAPGAEEETTEPVDTRAIEAQAAEELNKLRAKSGEAKSDEPKETEKTKP